MKSSQSPWKRATKLAAALVAGVLVWAPITAIAEVKSGDVHGVDYWYNTTSTQAEDAETGDATVGQYEDGKYSADVLTVTGAEDDMIFVNVTCDGRMIASHLPFRIGDNAVADGDGNYVGVMSINIPNLDPASQTYTIEAYADRAEQNLLYSGTLQQISARFAGDDAGTQAILLRTLAEGENRPLTMPKVLVHNSASYQLASDTPDADGVYTYERKEADKSTQVNVRYYDIANPDQLLRTDTYTLDYGKSAMYPVDQVIQSDAGEWYRTLQVTNQVCAGYGVNPGATDFAIMCAKLTGDWGDAGEPYVANIQYVDSESDEALSADELPAGLVDQLIVNKEYSYTPPKYIYITRNGDVVGYELADSDTLTFAPGDANAGGNVKIKYKQMNLNDGEATWVVQSINGTTDAQLALDEYKVTADSPQTHKVAKSYNSANAAGEQVTMVPVAAIANDNQVFDPKADSYDLTFENSAAINRLKIYYAPEGTTTYDDYTVTVNYVNITNGQTVGSQSIPMSGSMVENREYYEIQIPANYTANGANYVLLNGQDSTINHNYFSPHTYTVYYRNANDDLHTSTVVTNVRTVYTGTTVTDGGTTVVGTGTTTGTGTATATGTAATGTAAAGTGTGTGTAAATPPAATLTDNGGLNLITTDTGASTLVRDDGTSVTGERIDEDANPLAAPDNGDKTDGAEATKPTEPAASTGIPTAVIAGIVAAVAGVIIYILLNRHNDNEDA